MLKNEELLRFFKTAYCFTDSQRNTAYENWISENVKDKIVIDLGAGSGILCYLAVKHGAKKVYALERRGRLIHRMKEILGDTVEYIHADLLETELPECDIYLHEWLTSELWNEKRFLKNFYKEVRINGFNSYTPDKENLKKFSKKIIDLSSIGLKKRNIENAGKTEDSFLEPLIEIIKSGESPALKLSLIHI